MNSNMYNSFFENSFSLVDKKENKKRKQYLFKTVLSGNFKK